VCDVYFLLLCLTFLCGRFKIGANYLFLTKMHQKILRSYVLDKIRLYQKTFPVVAILGPRQSGKSTLAKELANEVVNGEYFDLENFETALYISSNYLSFFRSQKGNIVFLDEIQKLPDIFQSMRGVIDEDRRNGNFFILGSASSDLLKQSSESLTGRIGYIELTPFNVLELGLEFVEQHWLRGGFPESYLADSSEQSLLWREAYIKNIIEKDVKSFKSWNVDYLNSAELYKLFQLLAHLHGRELNYSEMGSVLGHKYKVIQKYVDLFEKMYLLRVLRPYFQNTKKRLKKSPKVYIRDSGLLHSVARIKNKYDLLMHPLYGFSFEGYVIENLISVFEDASPSFYRTSKNEEIDLILEYGLKKVAIEVKTSESPSLTKKGVSAIKDVKPDHTFVVVPSYGSPNTSSYEFGDVTICDIFSVIERIADIFS